MSLLLMSCSLFAAMPCLDSCAAKMAEWHLSGGSNNSGPCLSASAKPFIISIGRTHNRVTTQENCWETRTAPCHPITGKAWTKIFIAKSQGSYRHLKWNFSLSPKRIRPLKCHHYGARADIPMDSVQPSGPGRARWHICTHAGDFRHMHKNRGGFGIETLLVYRWQWKPAHAQMYRRLSQSSSPAAHRRKYRGWGKVSLRWEMQKLQLLTVIFYILCI